MDLVDTDVLIDVQRGHPPALAWFASVTTLPGSRASFIPGLNLSPIRASSGDATCHLRIRVLLFDTQLNRLDATKISQQTPPSTLLGIMQIWARSQGSGVRNQESEVGESTCFFTDF
jgi:hypothetical protein